MQTIRLAAVSMNAPFERLNQILVDVESWCRRCAEAGAELVLFPELLVHGHCTPNTWELAEPVTDGPSTKRLIGLAGQSCTANWFAIR